MTVNHSYEIGVALHYGKNIFQVMFLDPLF